MNKENNILKMGKGFVKRKCCDCLFVKYSNDLFRIKWLKNRK